MTLETTLPIRGYLLVEPEVSETKKKAESIGFIIQESALKGERPQSGTVLKVGSDLLTDYGATIPSPVLVGAKILFKKWGGNEVKIDDKDYFFIRFDDVLGVC